MLGMNEGQRRKQGLKIPHSGGKIRGNVTKRNSSEERPEVHLVDKRLCQVGKLTVWMHTGTNEQITRSSHPSSRWTGPPGGDLWMVGNKHRARPGACMSISESSQAVGWSQPTWVLLWVFIIMTTTTSPNSHSSILAVHWMWLRINVISWRSTLNIQRLLHKWPDASLRGLGVSLYNILPAGTGQTSGNLRWTHS